MSFKVTTNKDCYLTLLDFATSGKIHILFPNGYQKNNLIQAGKSVQIPAPTADFEIEVAGKTGTERVLAICRTQNQQPVYQQAYDFSQGRIITTSVRDLNIKPSSKESLARLRFPIKP